MKKITIIGTGYVGLVTGTCLADLGNSVTCIDNNITKINSLKKGISPIYEIGIEKLIKDNYKKNLFFSSDIKKSIKESEIIFIAVGTPEKKDGSVNIDFLFKVVDNIAKNLNGYKLIINKTTAPVGTLHKIKSIIKKSSTYPFDVASNPEFLKEGTAIEDFFKPDRIICGVENQKSFKILKDIYKNLKKKKIIKMDINSAEMTKYASNVMLATRISFMNEIANYCEKTNANIESVKLGMSLDKRIGKYFLNAGLGYGGSCFPKDVNGLLNDAKNKKIQLNVLAGTHKTNQNQKEIFFKKIKKYWGAKLKSRTLALWGLSFKPNTDDIREASSIHIINRLLENKAKLRVNDPQALKAIKDIFKNKISYHSDPYETLKGCDALIVCTEWEAYVQADFEKIKKLLKNKIIFDGRNSLKEAALKNGFRYFGVGI